MSDSPLRVAIIVGSTRAGRFGVVVARWFTTQARQRDDMALDVIDLADVDLPAVMPAGSTDAIDSYVRRVDSADAFVVVTPEYNHGYPASLKQAIDLTYAEWSAKPVAFVSYGGVSGPASGGAAPPGLRRAVCGERARHRQLPRCRGPVRL